MKTITTFQNISFVFFISGNFEDILIYSIFLNNNNLIKPQLSPNNRYVYIYTFFDGDLLIFLSLKKYNTRCYSIYEEYFFFTDQICMLT